MFRFPDIKLFGEYGSFKKEIDNWKLISEGILSEKDSMDRLSAFFQRPLFLKVDRFNKSLPSYAQQIELQTLEVSEVSKVEKKLQPFLQSISSWKSWWFYSFPNPNYFGTYEDFLVFSQEWLMNVQKQKSFFMFRKAYSLIRAKSKPEFLNTEEKIVQTSFSNPREMGALLGLNIVSPKEYFFNDIDESSFSYKNGENHDILSPVLRKLYSDTYKTKHIPQCLVYDPIIDELVLNGCTQYINHSPLFLSFSKGKQMTHTEFFMYIDLDIDQLNFPVLLWIFEYIFYSVESLLKRFQNCISKLYHITYICLQNCPFASFLLEPDDYSCLSVDMSGIYCKLYNLHLLQVLKLSFRGLNLKKSIDYIESAELRVLESVCSFFQNNASIFKDFFIKSTSPISIDILTLVFVTGLTSIIPETRFNEFFTFDYLANISRLAPHRFKKFIFQVVKDKTMYTFFLQQLVSYKIIDPRIIVHDIIMLIDILLSASDSILMHIKMDDYDWAIILVSLLFSQIVSNQNSSVSSIILTIIRFVARFESVIHSTTIPSRIAKDFYSLILAYLSHYSNMRSLIDYLKMISILVKDSYVASCFLSSDCSIQVVSFLGDSNKELAHSSFKILNTIIKYHGILFSQVLSNHKLSYLFQDSLRMICKHSYFELLILMNSCIELIFKSPNKLLRESVYEMITLFTNILKIVGKSIPKIIEMIENGTASNKEITIINAHRVLIHKLPSHLSSVFQK